MKKTKVEHNRVRALGRGHNRSHTACLKALNPVSYGYAKLMENTATVKLRYQLDTILVRQDTPEDGVYSATATDGTRLWYHRGIKGDLSDGFYRFNRAHKLSYVERSPDTWPANWEVFIPPPEADPIIVDIRSTHDLLRPFLQETDEPKVTVYLTSAATLGFVQFDLHRTAGLASHGCEWPVGSPVKVDRRFRKLGIVNGVYLAQQLRWHWKDHDRTVALSWPDPLRPVRTDGQNTIGVLAPCRQGRPRT